MEFAKSWYKITILITSKTKPKLTKTCIFAKIQNFRIKLIHELLILKLP